MGLKSLQERRSIRGRSLFAASLLFAATPLWAASARFVVTPSGSSYDYAVQTTLPAAFGNGEYTLELWIQPDSSFPVGSTADGTAGQRTNWSNSDPTPYGSSNWWFKGNFLLDGHNNNSFSAGTFSLQVYGGGRVRWLIGDGTSASVAGGVLAVQATPAAAAPSLLDGNWHQVTLVRRCPTANSASYELWVDGTLIGTESSSACTNMRNYWNSWTGFPSNQAGWFWGAEKQAALGPPLTSVTQYEDYKGLLDELRFWSRAKSSAEISTGYAAPVTGSESGLVGVYRFSEGSGSSACSAVVTTQCLQFVAAPGGWNAADAPLSASDSTPPTQPTGLNATVVSSSRIDLAWTASTDNVGVTRYAVLRNGTVVRSDITTTSFSDVGLSASTTYTYVVRAFDAAGNQSADSASRQATTLAATDTQAPTVPAGLQATVVNPTRIDLSWNAATDNVGVASYRILRDGSSLAGAAALTQTTFSDTTAQPSRTYSYSVSAIDAAGNRSAESAAASASTPAAPDVQAPTAPTGLQATSTAATQVDLAWSASTDNVAVTRYAVLRNGTVVRSDISATSFRDTGLAAATTYSYLVRAFDAAGNQSPDSNALQVTTAAAADTQAPSVPGSVTATANGSSQITVSWSAATDNVAVASYRVQRNGASLSGASALSGTSFTDTGLAAGTAYSYTVSAVDAAGNRSAESAVASATTASDSGGGGGGGGGGGSVGGTGVLLLALLWLTTALQRLGPPQGRWRIRVAGTPPTTV